MKLHAVPMHAHDERVEVAAPRYELALFVAGLLAILLAVALAVPMPHP